MNVSQARVVLRPRGAGEIIDLASHIVGQHALGLYARLFFWVLLPCYAACLALRYVLELAWWWVWPAAFVLTSLAQGVFTIAAGRWMFSEKLGALEVLGAFARRALSYTFATLFRLLLVTASVVAFIVTPAAIATLYLYVPEASLLEMAGPGQALSRSSNFSRHDRARAFGDWLSLVMLTATCMIVTHVLCDGLVDDILQLGQPFERLEDAGGSPYTLLGLVLSAPYVATARFLMYIDGRTRSDGWDIQVRFMAIAQERAEEAGQRPRSFARSAA